MWSFLGKRALKAIGKLSAKQVAKSAGKGLLKGVGGSLGSTFTNIFSQLKNLGKKNEDENKESEKDERLNASSNQDNNKNNKDERSDRGGRVKSPTELAKEIEKGLPDPNRLSESATASKLAEELMMADSEAKDLLKNYNSESIDESIPDSEMTRNTESSVSEDTSSDRSEVNLGQRYQLFIDKEGKLKLIPNNDSEFRIDTKQLNVVDRYLLKRGTKDAILLNELSKFVYDNAGKNVDVIEHYNESIRKLREENYFTTENIKDIKKDVNDIKDDLKTGDKGQSWIGSNFNSIKRSLGNLGKMEWIYLILFALNQGFSYLADNFHTLSDSIGNIFLSINDSVNKAANWVKDKLGNLRLWFSNNITNSLSDFYQTTFKGAKKTTDESGNTILTYKDGSKTIRSEDGSIVTKYNKDNKKVSEKFVKENVENKYDPESGQLLERSTPQGTFKYDSEGNIKSASKEDGWSIKGIGLNTKTEELVPFPEGKVPTMKSGKGRINYPERVDKIYRKIDPELAKYPPELVKMCTNGDTVRIPEKVQYYIYYNYADHYSVALRKNPENGKLEVLNDTFEDSVMRSDVSFGKGLTKDLYSIVSSSDGFDNAVLRGIGNIGNAIGIKNKLGRSNVSVENALNNVQSLVNRANNASDLLTSTNNTNVTVVNNEGNRVLNASPNEIKRYNEEFIVDKSGNRVYNPSTSLDTSTATSATKYASINSANLPESGSVDYGKAAKTLAVRNNNPGNIRISRSEWLGQIGSQKGFVTFREMKYGYRAMFVNLLNSYFKQGINTLRGIINKWAPPSENHTDAYINTVAKGTGLDPDGRIDPSDRNTMVAIASEMFKVESGSKVADIKSAMDGYKLFTDSTQYRSYAKENKLPPQSNTTLSPVSSDSNITPIESNNEVKSASRPQIQPKTEVNKPKIQPKTGSIPEPPKEGSKPEVRDVTNDPIIYIMNSTGFVGMPLGLFRHDPFNPIEAIYEQVGFNKYEQVGVTDKNVTNLKYYWNGKEFVESTKAQFSVNNSKSASIANMYLIPTINSSSTNLGINSMTGIDTGIEVSKNPETKDESVKEELNKLTEEVKSVNNKTLGVTNVSNPVTIQMPPEQPEIKFGIDPYLLNVKDNKV